LWIATSIYLGKRLLSRTCFCLEPITRQIALATLKYFCTL